uniref:Uncharacterized protein n=1 Tax=Arundo donax TaxID=35708 RepID=A0A0A9HBG2_ARUDO
MRENMLKYKLIYPPFLSARLFSVTS